MSAFFSIITAGNALADNKSNTYMDNFLGTAYASEVHALNLEPATVPEFEIEFQEQVKIFGNVKGKAEFEEGTLEGLADATREADCKGLAGTGPKTINCTISYDKLKVTYNGKMKYGKMPKLGIKGKAKIADSLFFLEITQDGPRQPIVKNFTCTQMGTMKVKFSGLGPLNRFMNVLEKAFVQHVQTRIFDTLNQKVQYVINRALSKDSLHF